MLFQFHTLYFLSFGLILVGLIFYSVCPPTVVPPDGSRTSYTEMAVDDVESELQYDQDTDRLCENTTVSYQRTKHIQTAAVNCDNHCGQYGRLTLKSSTKEEDEEQLMMSQEMMAQDDLDQSELHRHAAILSDIPRGIGRRVRLPILPKWFYYTLCVFVCVCEK